MSAVATKPRGKAAAPATAAAKAAPIHRAAHLDDRVDPYTAILNASACAGLLANSVGSDVMWALNSLIDKAAGKVEAAHSDAEAGRYSEEAHDDASNELAGVLGLLRVLDDGTEALMGACETLVIVCKAEIDRTIHERLIAGAPR